MSRLVRLGRMCRRCGGMAYGEGRSRLRARWNLRAYWRNHKMDCPAGRCPYIFAGDGVDYLCHRRPGHWWPWHLWKERGYIVLRWRRNRGAPESLAPLPPVGRREA